MALILAEPATLLGYLAAKRRWFPFASYRTFLQSTAGGGTAQAEGQPASGVRQENFVEVLHPYLGYVWDPTRNPPPASPSDWGFGGPTEPLFDPPRGASVVVVLGGSVAWGLLTAYPQLESNLARAGREVVAVNLAMPGYKQPQQLMTLLYFLSLGAHPDIVINLDGFNEVVLPTLENLPAQGFPFFPRAWNLRVTGVWSTDAMAKLGVAASVAATRRRWARLFLDRGMYRSSLMCLVWRARDLQLQRENARLQVELEALQGRADTNYAAHGPRFSIEGDDPRLEAMAAHWARCSLLMREVCAAQGIRYYHFLQPNQYVEGSKPMGREEQERALAQAGLYSDPVRRGYAHLRRQGEELLARGVRFEDLTMVFCQVDAPMYADACCHLTPHGYAMVVDQMVDLILADQPSSTP